MQKVLIIGGDSDYNLGDAAILASLCACLHAAGAKEVIVTSSLDSPRLPAGASGAIRRGFGGTAALVRAARAADVVVIGGGGLLQDDDSRVKMPYWASRVAALKLANPNIVGHSVGAGPLKHPESRLAARFTCNALASITVRDAFAQAELQACTSRPIEIVPDPAFMLKPAAPAAADAFLGSLGVEPGRPVIGLALRKWFHPRGGFVPSRLKVAMGMQNDSGKAALSRLLERLSGAVSALATQMNASILLLPTYSAPYENDVEVCEAFARLVKGPAVRIATILDPALYKAVTGRLSVLVSSRMHPLILAAGMGTPLVGLAYNGKFQGMFDMLGVPRRMVWLDEAGEDLPVKVQSLVDAALQSNDDLQQRATRLGDAVSRRTAALLDGDMVAKAA